MRFRVFRIERALPIADERRPSVNFKATLTVEHEMACTIDDYDLLLIIGHALVGQAWNIHVDQADPPPPRDYVTESAPLAGHPIGPHATDDPR